MMIDKEVQIHQRAYDQAIDSKTQEKCFHALEPLKNLKLGKLLCRMMFK